MCLFPSPINNKSTCFSSQHFLDDYEDKHVDLLLIGEEGKRQQSTVNSLFPRTARLWNSLPIECFSLTYNLNGFKF